MFSCLTSKYIKLSSNKLKKYEFLYFIVLGLLLTITGCVTTKQSIDSGTYQTAQVSREKSTIKDEQWRRMNIEEQQQNWDYILSSPLGIAALNQLAIEGFISPVCSKTFYVSQEYGLFKTLLQVKCPSPKGVSIAVSYQEMQIIFSRFEDNIENFEVKRIYDSQ